MKKKLLIILSLAALLVFAFTSCDIINGNGDQSGGDEDCVHTFSDGWVYNSAQHWHVATCEHTEQKSDLASHVDDDQDGNCDVCNYKVDHVHTFKEEWTKDEVGHWHTATCKHPEVKGDYANHLDNNANGKCDVCDADIIINIGSNAELIAAILAAKDGVTSGSVLFDSQFISLAKDGISKSSASFDYIFGNNCAYFSSENSAYSKNYEGIETTASSSWKKWQESLGGENVFGVYQEDDGEIAMDGTASIDTLKGYYFVVSTLTSEYGAENILYTLYNLSVSSSASELEWVEDEDTGLYTFTFNYLQINRDVAEGEDPNVNYYELSVSFTHNDYYVLTSLDIVCDCYTNSLQDEADHDYTYDDATGTITMKPEGQYQADTYTFKVTQIAGDRTYVNENPRSKFLPETFELFSNSKLTNPITNTINATADKIFNIYLGNFLPEGTSITFDPASFKATIEIDGATYESDGGIGLSNEVLYFAHTVLGAAPGITCNIHQAGTYTLTVSIGTDYTKTVTIVVTGSATNGNDTSTASATTIEVNVTGVQDWSVVADNPDYIVSFTATKSGMYTVNIPKGLAAYDKLAYDNTFGESNAIDPWVDLSEWNAKAGSFDVYLAEGETYEFYVATYITNTYEITYYYNEQ